MLQTIVKIIGIFGLALAVHGCGGDREAGLATDAFDAAGTSGANASDSVGAEAMSGAAATNLGPQLAVLAHRKSLIADANDIKRLQRIYGYYLDRGLWDEMADLFAVNATIEIGLDGVYVGQDRIREYLYELGNGRSGLAPGQLNEHLQLMPVVTVAPDGMTAKARWRAIMMAGELGASAIWGEGPHENEYIKEGGVWKLSKVHWFQSVVVPYEGGWQVNEDVNQGIWASDRLSPDRSPSVAYETWPGTYLPPFHFPNPVLAPADVDIANFVGNGAELGATDAGILAENAAALTHEVTLLEDENAIENLQRIYGFYVEEGFWREAADLFTDGGTIEIGGSGVYIGQPRIYEFLSTLGTEFPEEGRLFDRMQLQPVVHVAPDGRTAKARWRLFAQEAMWTEYSHWGTGVYENTYVKTDGVWKIETLHAYHTMYTPYEDGWGVTALPNDKPSESLPPDQLPSVAYEPFPAYFVVPFHYQNPVTGAPVYAESPRDFTASSAQSAEELSAQLVELEQSITRLEDFDALEKLNAVYGYYLARNQWDDLTGIFAQDGTIEIAMRGVYEGSASVRRNLNLYGEAGIHHGLLHNHMQYQPVIHIALDGETAKMRSRAFSIMGQYEAYSMWMGGVYENNFIKQDGIWKIATDQVFNTYFVPYALGWKEAVPRPPPGISDTNPPDSPPTTPFDMYPSAFLPPYHYSNPVTGNLVAWPSDD